MKFTGNPRSHELIHDLYAWRIAAPPLRRGLRINRYTLGPWLYRTAEIVSTAPLLQNWLKPLPIDRGPSERDGAGRRF